MSVCLPRGTNRFLRSLLRKATHVRTQPPLCARSLTPAHYTHSHTPAPHSLIALTHTALTALSHCTLTALSHCTHPHRTYPQCTHCRLSVPSYALAVSNFWMDVFRCDAYNSDDYCRDVYCSDAVNVASMVMAKQ